MSFPRYERYKDSGVEWLGEVPQHWQVEPLYWRGKEREESNAGLINSNLLSLSYGRIINKDIETSDGLLPESFETYQIIYPGDIIFRLTDLQNDKRSLRTAIVSELGIITFAYSAFEPHTIVPAYLSYLLRDYDLRKIFYSMGGGVRQSMKFDDIKRLPTLVPSEVEQANIVSFLDFETSKIDTLIEEQRRLIELLKEKRQAVISHAVTKGLNPDAPMKDSGVEWLGDVPAHWPIHILKRAFRAMDYGISESLDSEGAVAILRMGNIQDGKVVTDDLKYVDAVDPALILREGDLLYNRTNSLDLIGKVGMFTGIHRQPVSYASYLVRLRTGDESNPAYFAYLLNTDGILALARSNAFVAIGQCNLNPTRYAQILVALPTKSEQDEIAQYLDKKTSDLDVLKQEAEDVIKLLQERRSALISAAVTGKIDVCNYIPKEAA